MEHAQREEIYLMECFTICNSLNPYFNGTCSKRSIKMAYTTRTNSLNPYFNGTCSKSCNIESN